MDSKLKESICYLSEAIVEILEDQVTPTGFAKGRLRGGRGDREGKSHQKIHRTFSNTVVVNF